MRYIRLTHSWAPEHGLLIHAGKIGTLYSGRVSFEVEDVEGWNLKSFPIWDDEILNNVKFEEVESQ